MKNEVRRVMGAGKPTFTCRCHLRVSVVFVSVFASLVAANSWLKYNNIVGFANLHDNVRTHSCR
jgi:hypothetical protein